MLAQSRKEIEQEDLKGSGQPRLDDFEDDYKIANSKKPHPVIDIDENGDYEQQNKAAHDILNDNVNKHEQIVA